MRIRDWDRIHQKFCVWMQRLFVDQRGIADLTDLTEEHDTHTVGNKTDDRQVVADKQIRQAVLCLNVFKQVEHLALYRYVQRGYRLIADDKRRMQCNSSCDSDPLALTALACELYGRGFSRPEVDRLLLSNPEAFMSQSPKFRKVSARLG